MEKRRKILILFLLALLGVLASVSVFIAIKVRDEAPPDTGVSSVSDWFVGGYPPDADGWHQCILIVNPCAPNTGYDSVCRCNGGLYPTQIGCPNLGGAFRNYTIAETRNGSGNIYCGGTSNPPPNPPPPPPSCPNAQWVVDSSCKNMNYLGGGVSNPACKTGCCTATYFQCPTDGSVYQFSGTPCTCPGQVCPAQNPNANVTVQIGSGAAQTLGIQPTSITIPSGTTGNVSFRCNNVSNVSSAGQFYLVDNTTGQSVQVGSVLNNISQALTVPVSSLQPGHTYVAVCIGTNGANGNICQSTIGSMIVGSSCPAPTTNPTITYRIFNNANPGTTLRSGTLTLNSTNNIQVDSTIPLNNTLTLEYTCSNIATGSNVIITEVNGGYQTLDGKINTALNGNSMTVRCTGYASQGGASCQSVQTQVQFTPQTTTNTTCYRCTASATDGNACESTTVTGTTCPTGYTTNSNCAQAAGGSCPAQVTCYRCTALTTDGNTCESTTSTTGSCPAGYTTNSNCAQVAGGSCPVTSYTCPAGSPPTIQVSLDNGSTWQSMTANTMNTYNIASAANLAQVRFRCTGADTSPWINMGEILNASKTWNGTGYRTTNYTPVNPLQLSPYSYEFACYRNFPPDGSSYTGDSSSCLGRSFAQFNVQQTSTACYKCTDSLTDGSACQTQFVSGSTTCASLGSGWSTNSNCAVAAGGSCPVQTTCYRCTAGLTDGNTCENQVITGTSCTILGSGWGTNSNCAATVGGSCPAQTNTTCYRCTTSTADGNMCEQTVVTGTTCPSGYTTNSNCAQAAGGSCPAQVTCYRCTTGTNDGNACESQVVTGSSCPVGWTTNSSCQMAVGGSCPVETTCYRCTASMADNNTCESTTVTGTTCPSGYTTNSNCAQAAGGSCPAQVTCYQCTASLNDGNTCTSQVFNQASCPTGWTTNSACSAVMPGATCPGPQCGNGSVDSGEQCDDGNTNNSDGCSNTCQWEPAQCGGACGASNGSTCPVGHTCNAGTCRLNECISNPDSCDQDMCELVQCGESCTTDADCPQDGAHSCDNGTCKLDTCIASPGTCNAEGCAAATCGDGTIDPGEACDPAAAPTGCSGTLTMCTASCTCVTDTSEVSKTHAVPITINANNAVINYSITFFARNRSYNNSLDLVDTLDVKVDPSWISSISDGGIASGSVGSAIITWSNLTVANNASITVTYTLTVPRANFGTYNNIVEASEDGEFIDDDNDQVIITTPNTGLFDSSYTYLIIGMVLILVSLISIIWGVKVEGGIVRIVLGDNALSNAQRTKKFESELVNESEKLD